MIGDNICYSHLIFDNFWSSKMIITLYLRSEYYYFIFVVICFFIYSWILTWTSNFKLQKPKIWIRDTLWQPQNQNYGFQHQLCVMNLIKCACAQWPTCYLIIGRVMRCHTMITWHNASNGAHLTGTPITGKFLGQHWPICKA